MAKTTKLLVMTAIALVMAGCVGEFHSGWDEPLELDGPVILEDAVVYLDTSFEELVVLRSDIEAGSARLDIQRYATGARPVQFEKSADGSALYVINRGAETLSIFEIGEDNVDHSEVALSSVYDQITVDPEGDFILLSNSGQASDTIIQNDNELGIVDLRDGVPDEVRVLTLPMQAQNLEMIPSFEFNGEVQRMAVALAPSEIAIIDFDAEREDDQVRSAGLTVSQADALRNPIQVVFDVPSGDKPDILSVFVLDDRSSDITQLVVQPSIHSAENEKLDVSINQLAAGSSPHYIAILELEDVGTRLIALDGNSPKFTLVDVASGESATFNLRMSVPAEKMKVYQVNLFDQDRSEKRVLAYSRNSSLVTVIRPESISVGSETPTLGQAVQEISLSARPTQVLFNDDADTDRAVVLHPGGNDGFTVLNLQTNRDTSFSGFNPSNIVFDGGSALGIFANTPHLVRFDLASGQHSTHELPEPGLGLYLSSDNQSLIVDHGTGAGMFTVLPRGSLAVEDSRLYEHVFLDGMLGQPAFEDERRRR